MAMSEVLDRLTIVDVVAMGEEATLLMYRISGVVQGVVRR